MLNRKLTSNESKHVLVENELKKLKIDSSYFIGKSYFEEDGTQNYLVFQAVYSYFERINGAGNGDYIYSQKSKGLYDENITLPTTSDYRLNPQLSYYGTKAKVKVDGSCLKQDKVTFNHEKVVNIYIVYEITKIFVIGSYDNYPTLQDALFGPVNLTKNAEIDRYEYSGYGIGFDKRSRFKHPSGEDGQNVIPFGVDMNSQTKTDNRKKDFLILGKGPTQGLEHTLTAEKCIPLILERGIQNLV